MTKAAARPAIMLELPFPPAELNPNKARRLHRMHVAPIAARYKQACRVLALNARRELEKDGATFPLPTPAMAIVTFVLATKQRRDLDNLLASFKAGLDGIVAAGLLSDDNAFDLRLGIEAVVGETVGVRVRLEAGE